MIAQSQKYGSLVRLNQAFYVCLITPTQSTLFWFCLQIFCQAGPPQRVQYLAALRNKSFPKTKRRIASSEIESNRN